MVWRFQQVVQELKLPPESAVWADSWFLSESGFPTESSFFLQEAFLTEWLACLELAEEPRRAIMAALPLFRKNHALRRLLWHCYVLLFETDHDHAQQIAQWPMLPPLHGAAADLFYVFVLLSGLPKLREFYRCRGISDSIMVTTLQDIELWMSNYHRDTGRWGLGEKHWLILHLKGRIFRLGRLQFERRNYQFDFHAYRNIATRRVIVLAGEGQQFRTDGQFDGVGGVKDPKAWTAHFSVTADAVLGNPITPDGCARSAGITLDLSQWKPILQQGASTLGVHIPAGGPLAHVQCGESFALALSFFKKHFPEYYVTTFQCESWLLDPQLERYLPPETNLIRFLREFYLLPLPYGSNAGVARFVYNKVDMDLSTASRRSTLEKAIVDHVRQGGHWREIGGVIFPEDFVWGSQAYRKSPGLYPNC